MEVRAGMEAKPLCVGWGWGWGWPVRILERGSTISGAAHS